MSGAVYARIRSPIAVAIVALALAVLLAGCAGENGGNGGDNGTAAKRAITEEGQARATAVVLRLSDFPNGWRGSAAEDEDGGEDEFRRCLGTDYSDLTLVGQAASDDFAMGKNTEVTSEAGVYASEDEAGAALEEFASGFGDAVEGCVTDLMTDAVEGEDVEVGEVDVGELSFTPPAEVDDARAWQIAVPVEPTSGDGAGSFSVTVYLDLIYLREGDMVATVDTLDALSPFDSELRDDLLRTVARRMVD